MVVSRPAVHPLEVAAAPPPPPPADPPAEPQQQQPQPEQAVEQPQQQQPQPEQAVEQQQQEQPQAEQAVEQPQGVENPQGVLMKDLPGMPGTPGALGLRIAQLLFAGIALAVMTSTNDFPSVTAFCFLVAVVILQVGDVFTGGLTLAGACASAGITVVINTDLDICSENHCAAFESAVAMAFMCWFSIAPTCLLNLWSMATAR